MGTFLREHDTKESTETRRKLLNQFLEISLSPIWTRMQKAIINTVSSQLDAFVQIQDERWAKLLARLLSDKENDSKLELVRLQNELASARNDIERLTRECQNLKINQPPPQEPSGFEPRTENDDIRRLVFFADADGVTKALKIAADRVTSRQTNSSDERKEAFIAELKRLIPVANDRIFTTEADNVIFVQASHQDESGFPEWLIVLNRVSPDSVGPAIGRIFRGRDGGPTGALDRRFNEIEIIYPAVIPGDVRFAADDPYVARDYVQVERIVPGTLRVS